MPRMSIINALELERFQAPPIFKSADRKKFFEISVGMRKVIESLRTPTNKVCFLVAFGYFRAAKRFFSANFYPKDIEYAAKRLELAPEEVSLEAYSKQTYLRHQVLIRDYWGFSNFNKHAQEFVRKEIRRLVRSQTRAKNIFLRVIDELVRKKIEIPSYRQLAYLIRSEMNLHKRELVEILEQHLTPKIKSLLDALLDKEEVPTAEQSKIGRFRLTLLKKFHQSIKPSKIRENVDDLLILHSLYQELRPVLNALDLSSEGLRYLATSVLKGQTSQLLLKSDEDRWLYLVAFIAHQYCRLQDALVDTFLLSTRNALNKAQRLHKEECYDQRPAQNQRLHRFVKNLNEHLLFPIKRIEAIINNELFSDAKKVMQIKALLAEKEAPRSDVEQEIGRFKEESEEIFRENDYYSLLASRSVQLQNRVSLIVKYLEFDSLSSCPKIVEAIDYYSQQSGQLTKNAPQAFLDSKEREMVIAKGIFRVSLYKVLLFIKIAEAIKAGTLNLKASYKYKPLDDYLIPKNEWDKNREAYIKQADLQSFADCKKVLQGLEENLDEQWHKTNTHILKGKNPHITFRNDGLFTLSTPGIEMPTLESLSEFFPKKHYISLPEVLSTVDEFSGFLNELEHWKLKYNRPAPSKKILIAGTMAMGCFIGTGKFARISKHLNESELETSVNWRFSADTLNNANDRLLEFMNRLELPNVHRRNKDYLHTSSDGQKYEVAVDSLNASYSYKYFGHHAGVSVGSFLDEREFLFYGNVFSSAEREAAYVIDGLMHNDVIKSDIHSTDTHGYSEVIFAAIHLLGFSFAPRIKNLKKQLLYSFCNRKRYAQCGYKVLPSGYINVKLIEEQWDEILRFIATIKLKVSTASQLFRRLNSYSRQHALYQALKAFGKIIKTIFILRYIDDLQLRQAIEKQLNKSESSNKFSKAVSLGNQEFLYGEREEQELAESCRRLIKNSIVCWNYLYLSKKLSNESNPERHEEMLAAIKHGSIVTWQHINLHGEYDFSDEKLRDSIGLAPPKNVNVTSN